MAKKSNLVFYRTKNGSIRCFDPTKKGKATNDAKNSDRKVVSAAKTGLKKQSKLKINASKEDEKNFKLNKDSKDVLDAVDEQAQWFGEAKRYAENRGDKKRAKEETAKYEQAKGNYRYIYNWNREQNPVGTEIYSKKNHAGYNGTKAKTKDIKLEGKTAATALKARKSKTKKK